MKSERNTQEPDIQLTDTTYTFSGDLLIEI